MNDLNSRGGTPLVHLQPKWVDFTATAGVLRCLQPSDDITRAKGLIFLCPNCRADKQKRHHNIFLFAEAPSNARPHGRFTLSPVSQKHHLVKLAEPKTRDFAHTRLYEWQPDGNVSPILRPQDTCGWAGMVLDGMVHT